MYTTVSRVKAELRQQDVAHDDRDEQRVLHAIDTVAARIDQHTGRTFAPRMETRYYDAIPMARGGAINGEMLWLDYDLISVNGVYIDGALVPETDWMRYPAGNRHSTRLIHTGRGWKAAQPYQSIEVRGVWCYRMYLDDAWMPTRDDLSEDIDAAQSRLKVHEVTGLDAAGYTPRFSPGQLVAIGEEWMQVRDVNVADNILTVERGVNGSPAVAHSAGAEILTWQPEPAIINAATRWATLLYKRRAQFNRTQVDGMMAMDWPTDMPYDVERTLAPFCRVANLRSV